MVAASVKEHPGYAAARAYVDGQRERRATAMISPQVIREFMVALTRAPISGRSFTPQEAIEVLSEWRAACNLLHETEATAAECLAPVERHDVKGKQVHDCNIVAVMNVHGVTRLATRNPDDFKRYTGIKIDAITP